MMKNNLERQLILYAVREDIINILDQLTDDEQLETMEFLMKYVKSGDDIWRMVESDEIMKRNYIKN